MDRLLPVATDRRWQLARLFFVLLAVLSGARLSVYMFDPAAASASLGTASEAARPHSCVAAYVEAARRSAASRPVYAPSDGPVGTDYAPFQVEKYLYPPPFLLAARGLLLLSSQFRCLRALWFLGMGAVAVAAAATTARWVRGEEGARLQLLFLASWTSYPILMALQTGNAHLAVLSVATLGWVALADGRRRVGALLLAVAIAAKLFPVVLLVPLVRQRRLGDVAAIGAALVLLCLVTGAVVGADVAREYVTFELPRIVDGDAFRAGLSWPWVAAENLSASSAVLKPWLFGVRIPPDIVQVNRWVVAAGVFAVAWWAPRSTGRLAVVTTGMALLMLASLASPLAHRDYTLAGPALVLVMLCARDADRPSTRAMLAGAWCLFMYVRPPVTAMRPTAVVTGVQLAVAVTLGLYALYAVRGDARTVRREGASRSSPSSAGPPEPTASKTAGAPSEPPGAG